MPGFLTNLPVWVLVIVGAILAFIGYKYWQYKKSIAFNPGISFLDSLNLSNRDNPSAGGTVTPSTN